MMINPQRILWPTDFSELSLKGGAYARALCEHFGAQLHVIHIIAPVLTPDFSALLPVNVALSPAEPEMLATCRESLAKLVTERFPDRPVVTGAFFGNPPTGICEYARQERIDLIVVTTHGRTGLEHALIGSTAEKIVQHAPCPVLTVKSTETDFVRE